MSDEIFLALVHSLFQEKRSLIIGSLLAVVAIFGSFIHTGNELYIILALAFAVITLVRLHTVGRFHREVGALTTREQAALWEHAYASGGLASVAVLGIWCFVAMASDADSGVQLMSFTLTMGYIIGIFGRNFGSPSLVTLQILCAWLPITAALLTYGDRFHWFFAGLLLPLFFGIKFVADRIRGSLFDAVTAQGEAEKAQVELAALNEKLRITAATAVAAQQSAEAEAREAKQARARALLMAQRARQSRRNEAAAIMARDEHLRFLATMSHEIRTPLNGIVGALELLETAKTERVPELVSMAKMSADALLDIVAEVLDLSRLEDGDQAARSKEYDVRAVLRSVKLAMEPSAKKKGLSLVLDLPEDFSRSVVGDPAMVRQICMNLVGNALKFTESGFVQLAMRVKELHGGAVDLEIEVRDSGCGIDAADLSRIYNPFYTSGNQYTRGPGSSGLGLSIVKKTVELMAGRITCESEVGQGTVFKVALRLPLGDEAREREKAAKTASVDPAALSFKVLLAEDNEINGQIIHEFLEETSIEIDWARDGQEAVNKATANRYDLVLMDISMPGMDGVEACRCIREMQGEAAPKMIALTAHAISGDRQRYLDLGFDEYIAKPVRKAALLELLVNVFKTGEAAQPAPRPVPVAPIDEIDEEAFAEFVADRGTERANDLLCAICDELVRKKQDIEGHLDEVSERENLTRNFHNLISISATVGAQRMADRARKYEEMCQRGLPLDRQGMKDFFEGLGGLVEECRRRARRLALASA